MSDRSKHRLYDLLTPVKGFAGMTLVVMPTYILLWGCIDILSRYPNPPLRVAVVSGLFAGVSGVYLGWRLFAGTRIEEWALYADAWFQTVKYPRGGGDG